MLAFLSRFWLDRINSDLSETIRQQKTSLETTQNFEKDFISLQKRINILSRFYSTPIKYTDNINTIVRSTPPKIIFKNIVFDNISGSNNSAISLSAPDENSIVDFITNLMVNPDVANVDIKDITKKTKDPNYYLNIIATFK